MPSIVLGFALKPFSNVLLSSVVANPSRVVVITLPLLDMKNDSLHVSKNIRKAFVNVEISENLDDEHPEK